MSGTVIICGLARGLDVNRRLIPGLGIDDSSCPASCRASTPSRSRFAGRNAALYQSLADGWKQLHRVDARHKAGHDGGWKSSELV